MNGKEKLILEILCNPRRELYALEIVGEAQGQLPSAIVYLHLENMVDKGLLVSRTVEAVLPGFPSRKKYKVTEDGWQLLASEATIDGFPRRYLEQTPS